jgi:hypothetical protein
MAPLTFRLTRAQLETHRIQLFNRTGVLLEDDSGTVYTRGCVIDFLYSEPSQLLTITPVSKPFFLPESLIQKEITNWFSASLPPTAA